MLTKTKNKPELYDLIDPVILRLLGIIPFKINKKEKHVQVDTFFNNVSIIVTTVFCAALTYYNIFIMEPVSNVFFMRFAGICYAVSRTFNLIMITYNSRIRRNDIIELWKTVLDINEDIKWHFNKEEISYIFIKWLSVFVVYLPIVVRFSQILLTLSFHDGNNNSNFLYNSVYFLTELYNGCLRLMYLTLLVAFKEFYKIVDYNLIFKTNNILSKIKLINGLSCLHQKICYSKNIFNKIVSELVLFHFGTYFWELVFYNYMIVSKLYNSPQTNEWYISMGTSIHWASDAVCETLSLIFPAYWCALYVSVLFCP